MYDAYTPRKAKVSGAKPHPGKLVESAALSAVEAPDVTYRPHIPDKLIQRGELSDAQLEAVVYAGEAHSHILPSGERKGYLIGDGPGVGKGRTLAGIILDNWAQGRKKTVWLSETQNLGAAAVRDWTAMEQKESDLVNLSKYTRDTPIDRQTGILYTTYTTLASGLESMAGGALKAKQAKGQPIGTLMKTRLDQVLTWLGPDFDGVIIFDEAHNMQNSLAREGERGDVAAAAQALAGVTLQEKLPKARIVYSSATAATRVDALAFADRLGLWGEGTPFPSKGDFIGSIESSGLGAMEIVAQNMKAMGAYMSRNLDYSDVKYRKLEHALSPEQSEIYNAMAKGWQLVLQNLDKALEKSGVTGFSRNGEKKTLNSRAKSAAYGKFWGANQRFFNQILTSMQLPSVVTDMRAQLDAGRSILVQLVNTNEAIMERQIQAAEQSGQELDAIDMTPRQNLMQYMENAFPTAQFEEYTEPGSTAVKSRMVLDSKGVPVQNAEAVAMKEALLAELGSMRVPEGPLEILLNTFGPNLVAEVTGRSERLVRIKNPDDGSEQTQLQKRTPSLLTEDVKAFMAGKKRILVFSDKGGTGESYHADRTKKNQQQRVHYLLQPGWRADKAVQGLGRSHRTNQASAPEYVLTMTNIKGHKRFISTIARRLDQLGALTKGQRQAGSSGLIDAKDNLENKYAAGAVKHFFLDMFHRQSPEFNFQEVTKKLGLNNLVDKDGALIDERLPGVPQFLNRMLSLELTDQNRLFDEFYTRMERAVELATQSGTLDTGMETFRADGGITLKKQTEIYRDPQTKATVNLNQYDAKHSVNFLPTKDVEGRSGFKGYLQSKKTAKVWAQMDSGTRTTDAGNVVPVTLLLSPVYGHSQYVETGELVRLYASMEKPAARTGWDKQIAEHPPYRTESFSLATGNILRIWDRFPVESIAKIRRIQTTDGQKSLGRVVPDHAVDVLMVKLGKGERKAPTLDASQAFDAVLEEGATLKLANDWQIKRAKVNQEPRLELVGNNLYGAEPQLKKYGLFTETIQYARRYFIPSDKSVGERVLEQLLQHRQIIDVVKKGTDLLKGERGSIPVGRGPKVDDAIKGLSEDGDVRFTNEKTESRFQAAKAGVQPGGWRETIAKATTNLERLGREFPDLPDTAQFSRLRTALLTLHKQKGVASDRVVRRLNTIVGPFGPQKMDLFTRKVLLDDLAREAEQERALPFGLTKDSLEADKARVDRLIDTNPDLAEAVTKRTQAWRDVKARYQTAMRAIGQRRLADRLTKEDYFRHQILEHAQERQRSPTGTGPGLKSPTGRGFLKQRQGSTLDINANYLQADFEVMAQMEYDIEVAKVVKLVQDSYNIRPDLEGQAKQLNNDLLARMIEGQRKALFPDVAPGDMTSLTPIEEQLKAFKQLIGMGLSKARKAMDLPKTAPISFDQLQAWADDPDSPAHVGALTAFKGISGRRQYIRQLLGKRFKTWEDLVPEDHRIFQPEQGNVFYMAETIPHRLARELQEKLGETLGISAEQLKSILVMGGPKEQLVVPVEVHDTLKSMAKPVPEWWTDSMRQALGYWKQLVLISPRRAIRYNLRNLTGDADAAFVGNPHGFTQVRRAMTDLWPYFFGKTAPLTGEVKQWFDRGGFQTTLQVQELGDLTELALFRKLLEQGSKGGLRALPAKAFNAYWQNARLATDYREAILRYANYLDYLEQMRTNQGTPKNYGASIPENVDALADVRDKAFKLSNELLGAYDRVSTGGQNLRNYWYPFWSWVEVNFTRYKQLTKNAYSDVDPGAIGRIGVSVSGRTALKTAKWLLRFAALWTAIQVWNHSMFPDEEEELDASVRNRPHIVFGRDDKGKILYLSQIGAFGDLLSWFGLDAAPSLTGDVLHGRLTLGEAVQRTAKAPINKLIQGITPLVKMPGELLARKSLYPDAFRPRAIQDRGDYLANQLTVGPEVRALKGKAGPSYGGVEDLTGLVVQRQDPGSAAYTDWQSIEEKWKDRLGKETGSNFRSPKTAALRELSRAIQEKDTTAETKWRREFESLGGTEKNIEASVRALAPLSGLTKADRATVLAGLDKEERTILKRAEAHYEQKMIQVIPESRRERFLRKLRQHGWLEHDEGAATSDDTVSRYLTPRSSPPADAALRP